MTGAGRRPDRLLRLGRQRLPADDRRARAAGRRERALAASGSAAEFIAFGIGGFLVQLLTAPIAIAIDAVTFLRLGGPARLDPDARSRHRRRAEDREPVMAEIREGLRLVRHDPILRAFAGAQMALAALWGIFGATWLLFVLDELGLGPAALGVVAGGRRRLVVRRRGRRDAGHAALGRSGRSRSRRSLLSAVGNAFIPLAPAGAAARRGRLPDRRSSSSATRR